MTTAEKLTTVAENVPKVYEAGKTVGKAVWKNTFKQKTSWMYFNYSGCSSDLLPMLEYDDTENATDMYGFNQYATKLTAFPLLNTSKCTNFNNMFYGCTKLASVPALDTSRATTFDSMFYDCIVLSGSASFDTGAATTFYRMFYNCSKISEVSLTDTSNGTEFRFMFSYCNALEKINGDLNVSGCTSLDNMFHNCTALTEVRFTGEIKATISFQYSPLSKSSIESIVSALSDTVTGKTVTFKKTAKEAAFTDEEWAALIATKSNWTFTLG